MLYGKDVPGYPSLVVSVMVIGGVQLIMIGVLGEYIGKLLSEIKARPVYFVAEHSVKSADDSAKSAAGAPRARRSKRKRAHGRPPDLAVRRRLRHFPCGQRRHPRIDPARAHQRHLGDGGGAAFRRDEAAALDMLNSGDKARRARLARDADRAVQADERGLRAAARRPFPAARRT